MKNTYFFNTVLINNVTKLAGKLFIRKIRVKESDLYNQFNH